MLRVSGWNEWYCGQDDLATFLGSSSSYLDNTELNSDCFFYWFTFRTDTCSQWVSLALMTLHNYRGCREQPGSGTTQTKTTMEMLTAPTESCLDC